MERLIVLADAREATLGTVDLSGQLGARLRGDRRHASDLAAARENHMKCPLVGIGRYPVEELEYWRRVCAWRT